VVTSADAIAAELPSWITPVMIFTNLFDVHDYYQVELVMFLLFHPRLRWQVAATSHSAAVGDTGPRRGLRGLEPATVLGA
jgi:hypothetical protein